MADWCVPGPGRPDDSRPGQLGQVCCVTVWRWKLQAGVDADGVIAMGRMGENRWWSVDAGGAGEVKNPRPMPIELPLLLAR